MVAQCGFAAKRSELSDVGQDGILPPIVVNRPLVSGNDRRQNTIACPTKTIHAFTNRRGAQRNKELVIQAFVPVLGLVRQFHWPFPPYALPKYSGSFSITQI